MSHFTTLIIQKEHTTSLENLLAPYDEGLEKPKHIRKTKQQIIDYQRKDIQEYAKGLYADFLKDPAAHKEKYSQNPGHLEYIEKEFPEMLKMTTDEELYNFYRKNNDYCEYDDDGNELSTYNDDSKWDWYEIGGRWGGELILKDGTHVDSARVGDIDWKAMNKPDDKSLEYFNTLWKSPTTTKEQKAKSGTKAKFIKEKSKFVTRAVVTPDGEWHEPGEMGYWGCSSETDDEWDAWQKGYYDSFLKNLDDNDVITVIDCHI